jgi:hypothetical protein
LKAHTLTDEIRAHCENHEDWDSVLPRGFEKEFYESGGIIVRVLVVLQVAAKTEQLFELINQHEQVVLRRHAGFADSFDQAQTAAA